jgi:hypothetical protein
MSAYMLLCNFTDQGARIIKDAPKRRAAGSWSGSASAAGKIARENRFGQSLGEPSALPLPDGSGFWRLHLRAPQRGHRAQCDVMVSV